MDKLVTVDRSLFTGELGFVSDEIMNELFIKLRKVFGI